MKYSSVLTMKDKEIGYYHASLVVFSVKIIELTFVLGRIKKILLLSDTKEKYIVSVFVDNEEEIHNDRYVYK